MNKFKFTQGDWKADNTHCRTAINCGEKHVCMVNCSQNIDPNKHISKEEHEANVRLIVNSPELLKIVISDIRSYCSGCSGHDHESCRKEEPCIGYASRVKLIEDITEMKIGDILK